jgi:uncharacterized protein (DUF1778 family)
MEKAPKKSRLKIRCSGQARELLDKAATYARFSVSEFVLSRALAAAEEVIQANQAITLRPEDFLAFLDALDGPHQPNPALERAFGRYAKQVLR